MKVLMINGSPNREGVVFTALNEVGKELKNEGIDFEILQIGKNPVRGCIDCGKCEELGRCVFQDKLYEEALTKSKECDALIVGSPTYYAGPNGSLCALLDRLFYSASNVLAGKPGAAVVSCRRGGASATFDRLNKYFTINQMPVVTSRYWNSVHGNTPEEVLQDEEGLQVMRVLGRNMALMLKMIEMSKGNLKHPKEEEHVWTNFIR